MVLRLVFCLLFLAFFLGCSDPERNNPNDPGSNNYINKITESSSSIRSSSSDEDKSKLSSSSETQFSSSSEVGLPSSSSSYVEQSNGSTTVTPIKTDDGTILRGGNLAAKLGWLERNTESHNTYILEMSANDNSSSRTLQYSGAINVTIILRGEAENRTIRFSSNGTMFTVKPNVTFILDNNITLQGHSQNTGVLVNVDGGIFIMNDGATISGNSGVAVTVGEQYGNSGSFTMNGGIISDNSSSGIWLRKGDFAMNGGRIFGNSGNGVYLDNGTFSMTGGTISGNSSSGVYVNSGTFSMTDGIISNNTANRGGGVHLNSGTFTIKGGTITGNTASEYGGGVYRNNGTFTKTGGTITGYNSDLDSGNVVKDGAGAMVRRGHAVYINATTRKETTAGPVDNLSANGSTTTGGWDA
jgi:hypothetical protein